MSKLIISTDAGFLERFDKFPHAIIPKLNALRNLICETATEIESLQRLEETLKWGEPSFVAKGGSTIRIDWKERSPSYYAMYFQCTTSLVESFGGLYNPHFTFDKNRAILFQIDDELPYHRLKDCISAALQYHKMKHLPHLGMQGELG